MYVRYMYNPEMTITRNTAIHSISSLQTRYWHLPNEILRSLSSICRYSTYPRREASEDNTSRKTDRPIVASAL